MALTDIEELLATRLGFDIETVGPRAVATMVTRAMEQAGFTEPATYGWVLRRDAEVWDHFVSHFVIPETWFFRDIVPFKLAADIVRSHVQATSDRALRILSCPCSTGEEPYSLALSMLHAGAPAGSFSIDAVDVSRRALEFAERGVYHARSFRGESPLDHEPYFECDDSDGMFRLNDAAKAFVRFQQGNIIEPDFLREEAPYDVVFCRNLLIYLHSGARLQAMSALRRLITDEGILVVGHAEAAFAREQGFRPIGPSGAFAFSKSALPLAMDAAVSEKSTSPVTTPFAAPFDSPSVFGDVPEWVEPIPEVSAVSAVSGEPTDSLLAKATRLGDAGQLHEALQLCTEYLQQVPNSVEGYFLLGVLHDALGHIEVAARTFRKVLYLDPGHQEALLCLALKQEALGDNSGAALLRARAQRQSGHNP